MSDLQKIQTEMFEKSDMLIEMSEVFGALASDCRLEIIYLLLHVDALPSGEIARLTNCTPSQVSQYLSKMHDAWLVEKRRSWREVEYSIDRSSPFVQGLIAYLAVCMK